MHDRRARHALERAIDGRDAIAFGDVGARLHIGFVDLHDVGAGGEQILDLGVDRVGVIHRGLGDVGIIVVLRLLAHRERARAPSS